LQRLYDRAGEDYNLAVYYGWRQIFSDASRWTDYQVAQTKVSSSQAAANIKAALDFWQDESRTTANQIAVLGMNGIPPRLKPRPYDETCYPRSPRWRSGIRWGW
jgi:hypothetical protein